MAEVQIVFANIGKHLGETAGLTPGTHHVIASPFRRVTAPVGGFKVQAFKLRASVLQ